MPIAPLTPENVRDAVTRGAAALETLVRGNETAPLTRAQRTERIRQITQMLPTLQLSVEQRRLVTSVTGRILRDLSAQVEAELNGNTTASREQLEQERRDLRQANVVITQQEQQTISPSASSPISSTTRTTPLEAVQAWLSDAGNRAGAWTERLGNGVIRAFQESGHAGRAAMVAAGALIAVGAYKIWKWLPWWIQTPLAAGGGYLGLVRLWQYLSGTSRTPAVPGRPGTTPTQQSPPQAPRPNPAPQAPSQPTVQPPAANNVPTPAANQTTLSEATRGRAKTTQEATAAFMGNTGFETLRVAMHSMAMEWEAIGLEGERIGNAETYRQAAQQRITEIMRTELQTVETAVTRRTLPRVGSAEEQRTLLPHLVAALRVRNGMVVRALQRPTRQNIERVVDASLAIKEILDTYRDGMIDIADANQRRNTENSMNSLRASNEGLYGILCRMEQR